MPSSLCILRYSSRFWRLLETVMVTIVNCNQSPNDSTSRYGRKLVGLYLHFVEMLSIWLFTLG